MIAAPRRALPAPLPAVFPLGFGVSGPLGSPIMRQADVTRLVHGAIEEGVSLFDTAPFYGAAERRLGAALEGADRARLVLCTKAGKRRTGAGLEPDFAPDAVLGSLAESRSALGAERLDIVLLHGPSGCHLTDDLHAALSAEAAAGRIGAFGACVRTEAEAATACDRGFGAVIMAPVGSDAAKAAAQRGAAVLGIEAMRLAARDVRPPKQPSDLWYIARAARRTGLRPPSDAPEQSPAAALDQALRSDQLACVVSTTTRLSHLRENAARARAVAAAETAHSPK